jgi:hypothetical protein
MSNIINTFRTIKNKNEAIQLFFNHNANQKLLKKYIKTLNKNNNIYRIFNNLLQISNEPISANHSDSRLIFNIYKLPKIKK